MSSQTPSHPARGEATATLVRIAAAVCSLAVVSVLVVSGSRAAFTDGTVNEGNAWETGTVELSDDTSGVALFAGSDLLPGYGESNSIAVTYTGPAGSVADVSFTPAVTGDEELTSELLVTITRDEESVVSEVALDTLVGHTFELPAGETAAYQFDLSLPAETGDSAQGRTAGADFTWSASVTE